MNCPKCQKLARENDNYCHNCGFPLNKGMFKDGYKKLKSVAYDAELKCLFVNGVAQSRVTAFSLKVNVQDEECSLLVSKDDVYFAKC